MAKKESTLDTLKAENASLQSHIEDLKKDNHAWQSEYRAARAEVERVKSERDRIDRDFKAKTEKFQKILLEQGVRSRNKLMSVYFLLNTIKKMGTHREKEVAVSFLMQTVDDLVQDGGNLSWDQDLLSDLPF